MSKVLFKPFVVFDLNFITLCNTILRSADGKVPICVSSACEWTEGFAAVILNINHGKSRSDSLLGANEIKKS